MLNPVPPFDFDLSASIFSGGDPRIRSYIDGAFRQAIRICGRLVLVTVTSEGKVGSPKLQVRIAPVPVQSDVSKAAGRAVTSLFNLDLDLSPFITTVRDDAVMSVIARRLRGLKPPRTSTVFEALIDSIVEQQISLAAAHSIEKRVVRTFGDTLEIEGKTYFVFPTPGRLVDASPEDSGPAGFP